MSANVRRGMKYSLNKSNQRKNPLVTECCSRGKTFPNFLPPDFVLVHQLEVCIHTARISARVETHAIHRQILHVLVEAARNSKK